MTLADLPALNACLNSTSAIFLTLGYFFIRRGNKVAHRNCMVTALCTSAIFLTSYLIYHYNVGHTRFVNPAWFRPYYLLILFTHLVLAIVIVPLVLMTVMRAFKGKFEKHKKIARWTLPIWIYVSVTGVVIYFLLYQIFPQK